MATSKNTYKAAWRLHGGKDHEVVTREWHSCDHQHSTPKSASRCGETIRKENKELELGLRVIVTSLMSENGNTTNPTLLTPEELQAVGFFAP